MSLDHHRSATLRTTRRPAMGAAVEITTDASDVAVDAALAVVAALECRWSRFLPHSELSQLNRADGPAVARPSTARAIEMALAGTQLTRGWFDPTRGADVRAAGYRCTHSSGWGLPEPAPTRTGHVSFDGATGLVHIPEGVEFDLGGVAKGLAADIAASLLSESHATHVGVAVGGDVRIRSDTRVLVEIAAPDDAVDAPALIGLCNGGVAVSGPSRRRTDDGRHHLIDPFTARPAENPRSAAVVAASAAGAEMLATAAAIAPLQVAVEIIETVGATAWLVETDGRSTTVGEPDRFLIAGGWMTDTHRPA
ncbi:MAG: FAD:protein FMN transferase [Acidimicrobiales bacterium]